MTVDGVLPIDKPSGITSYDVIRALKKSLPRGTKIGHAGTLDPFARGVLLILLGQATRKFEEIRNWPKVYRAVAKLGSSSDTLDRTGRISKQDAVNRKQDTKEEIQKITERYVGEIEQVVPAYAAAKYRGRKLYEYAREGKEVPPKKKKVTVYSIEVLRAEREKVEMRVVCGGGTYIRQLTYDILKTLGVESYLVSLSREAVGEMTQKQSLKWERLSQWAKHLRQ